MEVASVRSSPPGLGDESIPRLELPTERIKAPANSYALEQPDELLRSWCLAASGGSPERLDPGASALPRVHPISLRKECLLRVRAPPRHRPSGSKPGRFPSMLVSVLGFVDGHKVRGAPSMASLVPPQDPDADWLLMAGTGCRRGPRSVCPRGSASDIDRAYGALRSKQAALYVDRNHWPRTVPWGHVRSIVGRCLSSSL